MPSRVRLGQSPLEVTALGVGCWSWGDKRYWRYEEDHGPGDVVDAFDACLGAGLDLFDTAEAYGAGKGEKLLGWLARKCGREIVVATKYAPVVGRGGPAAIPKGLAGSLKRMGLPRIDLYQLHWADREEVPIPATMDAFADAVEAGQVRAVGVSNFRAGEMREARSSRAARRAARDESGALLTAAPFARSRRCARCMSRARRDAARLQSARAGALVRHVRR